MTRKRCYWTFRWVVVLIAIVLFGIDLYSTLAASKQIRTAAESPTQNATSYPDFSVQITTINFIKFNTIVWCQFGISLAGTCAIIVCSILEYYLRRSKKIIRRLHIIEICIDLVLLILAVLLFRQMKYLLDTEQMEINSFQPRYDYFPGRYRAESCYGVQGATPAAYRIYCVEPYFHRSIDALFFKKSILVQDASEFFIGNVHCESTYCRVQINTKVEADVEYCICYNNSWCQNQQIYLGFGEVAYLTSQCSSTHCDNVNGIQCYRPNLKWESRVMRIEVDNWSARIDSFANFRNLEKTLWLSVTLALVTQVVDLIVPPWGLLIASIGNVPVLPAIPL